MGWLRIFFISETKGFVEWLWRTLPQSQKLVVKFKHASQVSDRPISLTFCCNTIDVKERWMNKIRNTVFSSVKAHVQLINAVVLPLFPTPKSLQTECRVKQACLYELCWGEAWFRRWQRYNKYNPKSQFLGHLISQLESLPHLRMDIQPFIYGHFSAFSTREKKWNRDITFYLLPILKTYEATTFCLTQMLQPPHLFTAGSYPSHLPHSFISKRL